MPPPPRLQQQQKEEQLFPLLDLSAARQLDKMESVLPPPLFACFIIREILAQGEGFDRRGAPLPRLRQTEPEIRGCGGKFIGGEGGNR